MLGLPDAVVADVVPPEDRLRAFGLGSCLVTTMAIAARTKLGFDLTKPLQAHGKDFNRAPFPMVDLSRFLK